MSNYHVNGNTHEASYDIYYLGSFYLFYYYIAHWIINKLISVVNVLSKNKENKEYSSNVTNVSFLLLSYYSDLNHKDTSVRSLSII